MARVRSVGGHRSVDLRDHWELASTSPGKVVAPSELGAAALTWNRACVPGTAALSERDRGAFSFEHSGRYDAFDWWYRCPFSHVRQDGARSVLKLGGLASLADVWLNGAHLLGSDNMFLQHEVDVTDRLGEKNELVLRFRSLDQELKIRKPRPRWRTRLIEQQSLRFHRTTLLGRMRAFTPPVCAVGPYRTIQLEERTLLAVQRADVRAELRGSHGVLVAAISLEPLGERSVVRATLVADDVQAPLDCLPSDEGTVLLSGELVVRTIPSWWPHTHGPQPRARVKVRIELDRGAVELDLGAVGFRSIELVGDRGKFDLRVNGEPIFCRGACWTTADIVALGGSEGAYRQQLELAKSAGMNMLRIAGTNFYETDLFYDLCDELGILVWQDFMFANMDYPEDESFVRSVETEVGQFLDRTQLAPSVAVLCGNSEVEQQVAMLGLPRNLWHIPLFRERIPNVCRHWRPDLPYWPSSPSGGTLPFHPNGGAAHYYGVGAYLRPVEDARRAEVRFASECLAFANVPEESTLASLVGGGVMTPQNVRWKERAPRDNGASWDFDDVRDHYLERLFGVKAIELRTTDIDRYLALGRVVTGEVMAAVFGEWRRRRSTCRGGLVFTYQDLWPGAGFGVIDSFGKPKAAYFYLKRALAPIALFISDEGNNGLWLHAINDTAAPLRAQLRVSLYRQGQTVVAASHVDWAMDPRSTSELAADSLFDHFLDTSYAYRFGPPGHDVVTATLVDKASGEPLARAFHFPSGWSLPREADVGLRGTATKMANGAYVVRVQTAKFAQSVSLQSGDYLADDDYFHVEPGGTRDVTLTSPDPAAPFSATLSALNAHATSRIAT